MSMLSAQVDKLRGWAEQMHCTMPALAADLRMAADTIWELRDELEQWHRLTANIELPEYPITEFRPKGLERENARLREQCRYLKKGDILHVLTDQEYIDQCERERLMQVSMDALDRENDELRKLCRDMLAHMRSDGCEGCVCKGRCDAGELDECVEVADFARRMRELGIEVEQ